MDFTREPIIETVVTPKEGCKLVVRSSKSTGQEEYFVDAVEVVSFGHSFFFRSLERPKAFLVPVSDYEILEVREARMVLKNVGVDRAIKIGGGRDAQMRGHREAPVQEKVEPVQSAEVAHAAEASTEEQVTAEAKPVDGRVDKKRDRRRNYRRRRGRDEGVVEGEGSEEFEGKEGVSPIELPEPSRSSDTAEYSLTQPITTTSILSALLPPPPTLISETIARYKDNALFRGAFYSKEEPKVAADSEQTPVVPIAQPEYGSFEVSEEEEEQIYQQRKLQGTHEAIEDQVEEAQQEETPTQQPLESDQTEEPSLEPQAESAQEEPLLSEPVQYLSTEQSEQFLDEASTQVEESTELPQEDEVSNGKQHQ